MRERPSEALRGAGVLALAALAALAGPRTGRAAPSVQDAVPPLVEFEARPVVGLASLPPSAQAQLTLSDEFRSVVATGPARQLAADLAAIAAPGTTVRLHAWLDASTPVVVESGAAGRRPRLELTTRWRLEEGRLVAGLGGDESVGFVNVREGEGVLLFRRGVTSVLLTPLNVSWSRGVPSVASPRVTLDLADVLVADALTLVRDQAGVAVATEGVGAERVSLKATNEPVEIVVAAIARLAGLHPRMAGGALSLVSGAVVRATPAVALDIDAFRYERPTLGGALDPWGGAPGEGCAALTRSELDALWHDITARIARRKAEALPAGGRFVTRVSRRVVVSSKRPAAIRLEATPQRRNGRLELDLIAMAADAESIATCTLVPPGTLTLALSDGRRLVYVIEADLKNPGRARSRSGP